MAGDWLIAVTVNIDGMEPRYDDFEWGIGSELTIAQILFLRTGSRHIQQQGSGVDVASWGIDLGVPVSSLRIRFDYADSGYAYVRDHMGVTIAWVF